MNLMKQIEELIGKLDDNSNDNDKLYEMIFQILYKIREPRLILKYLSYVGEYNNKIKLLDLLSDKSKIKYFKLCHCNEREILICSFKNDENKIRSLHCLNYDEDAKYNVVLSLKSDDDKIRCLDFFGRESLKASIIGNIKDHKKMMKALLNISNYYQKFVIDNYMPEELFEEYFYMCSSNVKLHIIKNINNDLFKLENMGLFNVRDQVAILATFQDEQLLLDTLCQPKYQGYIEEFLGIVNNYEFIENYFDLCGNIREQLQIINKVNNLDIKRKLINKLDNMFFKTLLLSNYDNEKNKLVSLEDVSDLKLDIDPRITFGVELESCVDKYSFKTILMIPNILKRWKIDDDSSIDGIEVISPILNYQKSDLQELKFICNLLKYNGFYIDEHCGGHIHFGADYFESIEEFNIFLNLYGNVEDVLYVIANKVGSEIRPSVSKYANKLKPQLDMIANNVCDFEDCSDLIKYIQEIKQYINERYYGLNLMNMNDDSKNTIEFRMPNGELEFEELLLNIRLFAKMLEGAKKISRLLHQEVVDKKDVDILKLYQRLITLELNDREKVSYFLNIIFDSVEERKFYYKRYIYNNAINCCDKKNDKKVLCLKNKKHN